MSAGHAQHLLEALPLVEALGEAEPGAGDAGQRLAPAQQVPGEVARLGPLLHELDPSGEASALGHGVQHGPLDLAQVERIGDLGPGRSRT